MSTPAESPESEWNEARIQKLIDDQVEESQRIEYKAAAALENPEEITKDVSAFANAAGGTLIYGVKEFPRPKNHLPERIDPVNGVTRSKEWLDQIISTIAPKIDGVRIIPVRIGPDDWQTCYVGEVPQGSTAHQARDCKYYRRYNFHVQPMIDHEIQDVMNRRRNPKLEFKVRLSRTSHGSTMVFVRIWNVGNVLPERYAVRMLLPTIVNGVKLKHTPELIVQEQEGLKFWRFGLVGDEPLFPGADVILGEEFGHILNVSPERVPEPTGDDVICTLYADAMPRVRRQISTATASADWA